MRKIIFIILLLTSIGFINFFMYIVKFIPKNEIFSILVFWAMSVTFFVIVGRIIIKSIEKDIEEMLEKRYRLGAEVMASKSVTDLLNNFKFTQINRKPVKVKYIDSTEVTCSIYTVVADSLNETLDNVLND